MSCPVNSSANLLGNGSSSRMRIRDIRFACERQRRDRLLLAYRRKLIEVDVETVTSFEVVKEDLDGYACTDKNRGSPEHLGIAVPLEIPPSVAGSKSPTRLGGDRSVWIVTRNARGMQAG